jgi:hypothetical protein
MGWMVLEVDMANSQVREVLSIMREKRERT